MGTLWGEDPWRKSNKINKTSRKPPQKNKKTIFGDSLGRGPMEKTQKTKKTSRKQKKQKKQKQTIFGDSWLDPPIHQDLWKIGFGPGPIRKTNWKPIASKFLQNKNVILHKDGANAYKLRVPGVLHDNVVHKKQKVFIKGKATWVKPNFTKIWTHKLPNSKKTLTVKAGTQIIDRFCGHGSQNPRSPMDVLAQRAECLECNNQYVERSPAPLMSRMSDQENKCLACQHSCFFSWHCDIKTKLADIAYNAAIGCYQSWSCLALRLPQALSFISSSCHATLCQPSLHTKSPNNQQCFISCLSKS